MHSMLIRKIKVRSQYGCCLIIRAHLLLYQGLDLSCYLWGATGTWCSGNAASLLDLFFFFNKLCSPDRTGMKPSSIFHVLLWVTLQLITLQYGPICNMHHIMLTSIPHMWLRVCNYVHKHPHCGHLVIITCILPQLGPTVEGFEECLLCKVVPGELCLVQPTCTARSYMSFGKNKSKRGTRSEEKEKIWI